MDDNQAWKNLVLWLRSKGMCQDPLVRSQHVPGAGRGLFTITDISPNTPLFTIPESAQMNLKTLAPLYRSICKALTAIQVISIHIFLHCPCFEKGQSSPDPMFGPYISILPRHFREHPLSWSIGPQENAGDSQFLLSSMPPGVKIALDAMVGRFSKDWKVVSDLLNENPHLAASTRRHVLSPFIPEDHVLEYLWAWLNVNTRCIYSRISASPSNPDNVTLCPVLDLANHTSISSYESPSGTIPTFYSPPRQELKEGQEVYLRYGSHSNSTLFTEYGFIETHSKHGGQADVQDIVENRFSQRGPLGLWMKNILTQENYWGNWKLYENPAPAHPSYRLLPVLRLLHCSLPLSLNVDATFDEVVAVAPELTKWQDTLFGNKDIVSLENESAVWKTLEDICNESAQRAHERFHTLEKEIQAKKFMGWKSHAARTIRDLWNEEKRVSQAVGQSIRKGEALN